MICRNARSSALTRGNPDVSALRNDDASVVGLRLHHADALLDKLIQIHIGKGQIDASVLDLRKVEPVIDHGRQMRGGGVEILDVFAIALIADRADEACV